METRTTNESGYKRQWPRIEVDGLLSGVDESTGTAVDVLNISSGGFMTLSSLHVSEGIEHRFRVSLGDGRERVIRGTAVHSRRASGAGQAIVTGWQATPHRGNLEALEAIIKHVTRVPEGREETREEFRA